MQRCRIEHDGGNWHDEHEHAAPRTTYIITPEGERIDQVNTLCAKRTAQIIDDFYAMPDRERIECEVFGVVDQIGDPSMRQITDRVSGEDVDGAVIAMMHLGWLRQKEDLQEHDWSYRMTKDGRQRFRDEHLNAFDERERKTTD